MEIQSISIPIKSERLSGLLYIPFHTGRKKLPSIVIFHGRGSSKKGQGSNKKRYMDRAYALSEKGFLTLVFDFRGCGESDGDFNQQTIAMGFEDAIAGYEFIQQHPLCDSKRIGVLGGSYGGYEAALLSSKFPIASLILSVPAIFQDKWWDIVPETLDLIKTGLFKQQSGIENTKAIASIQSYTGKLLVVEHEKDTLIPKKFTDAYYQNAFKTSLKKKEIIPNAPHSLHDKIFLDQSINIVTKWFTETL